MRSGEYRGGGHPPRSPEAQAAIDRVKAANRPPARDEKKTAILSTEEIELARNIKRALAMGEETQQQIADRLGVSRSLVGDVSKGRRYGDVVLDDESMSADELKRGSDLETIRTTAQVQSSSRD